MVGKRVILMSKWGAILLSSYVSTKRYLSRLTVVLCLFSSNFLWADGQVASPVLTEKIAVDIALRDNPNLAQMKERYLALANVPSQVGSLPDPMISVNAMNLPTDSFDRRQEAMTQIQIGVSQAFPFPGKLGLKEGAAEFDALAARYQADEVQLQLVKQVKTYWWQLYYLDRALETADLNKSLLKQFITVAKTKYETGAGLQQDVLLSQLELSKLMDQVITLKAVRRHQAIRLNILIDQPPNKRLVLPRTVQTTLHALPNEQVLYEKAESKRPRLRQSTAQMDAAKTRLNLAKRDYFPDFKLGVTYSDRTGDNPAFVGGSRADFLSVMIGVKVPLYANSKQAKAVKQKRHELLKNRYVLAEEKTAAKGEVSSAVTDYNQAKEQFSLFGTGIVPQAQQTVKSMLAGYQVSEVDFLNLIRAQVTLFNYELQYWKALSDAKQALAHLEAAIGEDVINE